MLVVQHDDDAPPGLLGDWLDARGAETVLLRHDRGDRAAPLVAGGGFDRLVSLGSFHAAYDDDVSWQADERAALAAAIEGGVPVLGVCFGGQSLARALGGSVRRAARPTLAWTRCGPPGHEGPWLEWHQDELLAPPDATEVVTAPTGVQHFRVGRHVGLQFHPEVTPAIVERWIAGEREQPPPAGIGEESARLIDRERTFAFFDALLGAG